MICSVKTGLRLSILFFFVMVKPVMAEDQPRRTCHMGAATITSDFDGGRVNDCENIGTNKIRLIIEPEDAPPINPSAWYAFHVKPIAASPIEIDILYKHSKHRYWPKISRDGKTWHAISKNLISQPNDKVLRISLPALQNPMFIAGQEVLTTKAQINWADKLAARAGITKSKLGVSLEGRELYKYESQAGNGSRDYVVFVGRQHPPEVTGALALMPFLEAVYADTALATRFRNEYGVVFVPVLNPDGVSAGHWRHSKGDKDLNRDWGPFTQPETQAIQREMSRFTGNDALHLFLDFHSTKRNVLYTQAEGEQTKHDRFTRDWVKAVKARVQNYEFERAERPLTEKPTSKNYVYKAFGVPAITYEVGDETDRQALADAARIFAEEMMRILLEEKGK